MPKGWVRSRAEDDETLYDVMHSPLDDLIVAPRVIGARDARALLYGGVYPVSEEGVTLKRTHRVSRRLVEDPVLYLSELSEAERLAYAKVRAARDHFLAAWLGLEAECRREGTALIDGAFEPLTDVRFPAARPWTRQVALLLAEALCRRVRGGQSRFLHGEIVDVCASLRERVGRRAVLRGARRDGGARPGAAVRDAARARLAATTSCRCRRSPASATST